MRVCDVEGEHVRLMCSKVVFDNYKWGRHGDDSRSFRVVVGYIDGG